MLIFNGHIAFKQLKQNFMLLLTYHNNPIRWGFSKKNMLTI